MWRSLSPRWVHDGSLSKAGSRVFGSPRMVRSNGTSRLPARKRGKTEQKLASHHPVIAKRDEKCEELSVNLNSTIPKEMHLHCCWVEGSPQPIPTDVHSVRPRVFHGQTWSVVKRPPHSFVVFLGMRKTMKNPLVSNPRSEHPPVGIDDEANVFRGAPREILRWSSAKGVELGEEVAHGLHGILSELTKMMRFGGASRALCS